VDGISSGSVISAFDVFSNAGIAKERRIGRRKGEILITQ